MFQFHHITIQCELIQRFILVPPRITSSGLTSMVVREGENVSLACEAMGYPPPHIVWRREDGEDININGNKVSF